MLPLPLCSQTWPLVELKPQSCVITARTIPHKDIGQGCACTLPLAPLLPVLCPVELSFWPSSLVEMSGGNSVNSGTCLHAAVAPLAPRAVPRREVCGVVCQLRIADAAPPDRHCHPPPNVHG